MSASVVTSESIFKALIAAGVIDEGERITRIVIDVQVRNVPVLHIRRLGDSRLLEVVETLAGIEVHDGLDDPGSHVAQER